jgi:hypothetical protein
VPEQFVDELQRVALPSRPLGLDGPEDRRDADEQPGDGPAARR